MSKETLHHLNTNTLIGNTDARGQAWYYRAEEQEVETNQTPAPSPSETSSDACFTGRPDPGVSP